MNHEQHPWTHQPHHRGDFTPTTGKGGFWHYGPNRTADSVIIGRDNNELKLALIRRQDTGALALPGGFIDPNETALEAALRETYEETGLVLGDTTPTLVYDGPVADHRATLEAWPHTSAFLFELDSTPPLVANDDALDAAWHPLATLDTTLLHGSHAMLAQRALKRIAKPAA